MCSHVHLESVKLDEIFVGHKTCALSQDIWSGPAVRILYLQSAVWSGPKNIHNPDYTRLLLIETYKSKCTLHHNLYAHQNYLRIAILLYYNENINPTGFAVGKSN